MKERGNFLKSSQKKIRWRKDKGKKDKEKKKRKEKEKDKKKKKKKQRGKIMKEGGECVIREEGETKRERHFPSRSPAVVETRQGKRQSWSTRRQLRMGTRNCEFRRIPKGRVSPTLAISCLVAM